MAGSRRRPSDSTSAQPRGAPVVQKPSLAARLGMLDTPEVNDWLQTHGRSLLAQQKVVEANAQHWRFKSRPEEFSEREPSADAEGAVVDLIDGVRSTSDPPDPPELESDRALGNVAPRKGQRTALARGFESLLSHPDFATHEFRLAALTATTERAAWNRAEFAGSAWALFEGLRGFYEQVRSRCAAAGDVPQPSSYAIDAEHPHLRRLAPPPTEHRDLFVAASRVGHGVTRLLELPAERGRTADRATTGSTWRLNIVVAGYPVRSWFGAGSTIDIELLDPAYLKILCAKGRGGPVAAAEAACGKMLGRSGRAIGDLIKALHSLRAAANYCADPARSRS